MAYERVKNAALPHAVSDAVADLADLLQKEVRLARAEISANIGAKLQAGVWMSAAAGVALIAALLAVQGIVFAIASFGIALHWACLIVAAVFAVAAALLYAKGRADAEQELTPTRTLNQIKRDISTAKEQLT
jgi:hypothetical protein